jgi:hypothetical protein
VHQEQGHLNSVFRNVSAKFRAVRVANVI